MPGWKCRCPAHRAHLRRASLAPKSIRESRMAYTAQYADTEPARSEVDAWTGLTLLEFGAPWCGICSGAQAAIAQALEPYPRVRHVKVEDGRGRPLGRSFAVKLWPT